MARAQVHRGPDGFGYLLADPAGDLTVRHNAELRPEEVRGATVGFAHRRLSIFDLSDASLQPMLDERRELAVLYNGEIFNFEDLRAELQGLGHRFSTTGDTEVLLASYREWGTECVTRFNGMWAFALLDRRHRTVFLSRDRYGIKPLHYAVHRGALYFASEIKGLLAVPGLLGEPHRPTVSMFLQTGLLDLGDATFFDGIRRFPAAHSAVVRLDADVTDLQPRRYWNFPETEFRGSDADAIAQFRDLFTDAVRLYTHSDVPVGTCLSGGLDSSAIVCTAESLRRRRELAQYSHTAYGYVSSEPEFSEQKHMQTVVDATGVNMQFIRCEEERFLSSIPRVLQGQDEPFGSASAIVQWLVFERAKETGMTVMLDGQGADEILGGYHHFLTTLASHFLATRQVGNFMRMRREYPRELGAPFPIPDHLAFGALAPSWAKPAGQRLLAWRARQRAGNGAAGPSGPSAEQRVLQDTIRREYRTGQSYWNGDDNLNVILQRYVSDLCLPALLRLEDRNSMAHSIEGRVPFLDHRLVEFLFTLRGDLKIRGARTKYVLREAMRGILPESIRMRRDKLGFKATPSLTFTLVQRARPTLVTEGTDYEREWLDRQGVAEILGSSDRSPGMEFVLWRLFNLKLWLREHWGAGVQEPLAAMAGRR